MTLTDEQAARFWSKIDKSGGPDACWPWMAGKTEYGYGVLSLLGKKALAHRVSMWVCGGEFNLKLFVCHHCDNPPCCNPHHLFLGTNKDNTDDRDRKGRVKSGEACGSSKLTKDQVEAIRQEYTGGGMTQLSLAKKYGVGATTIHGVVNCLRWRPGSEAEVAEQIEKKPKRNNRRFSASEIEAIREEFRVQDVNYEVLAERHGVWPPTISRIVRGITGAKWRKNTLDISSKS